MCVSSWPWRADVHLKTQQKTPCLLEWQNRYKFHDIIRPFVTLRHSCWIPSPQLCSWDVLGEKVQKKISLTWCLSGLKEPEKALISNQFASTTWQLFSFTSVMIIYMYRYLENIGKVPFFLRQQNMAGLRISSWWKINVVSNDRGTNWL